MISDKIQAIILAAGKSTRFNTGKSKQLVHICGRPMILYPLKALDVLKIPKTVVIGKQSEEISDEIKSSGISDVDFIEQKELNGTGGAVLSSMPKWKRDNILIVNGDLPLITSDMLKRLCTKHVKDDASISFFTSYVLNPHGYGRVIDSNGRVSIIEEKACNKQQRDVNCINAGIYLIKRKFLEKNIEIIKKNKVTGEYHFTDIVIMASEKGLTINTISVPYDNVRGVNTLRDLWEVEQIKRSEIIDYWMSKGVRFELAQSIHVDLSVKIGRGSFIGTGVHLLQDTTIGENCFISAFTIIENTTVGDNTRVHSHSVIQDSKIGKNIHVGPFARLRNNVVLKDGCNIGNFVEIKNSTIESGTKAKHLAYLGDATIGSNANIGAGTITCNHDGVKRNKTIIEDNAYIGSNNTLVAPLTVSKNAFTAAGSTITRDVPEGDLAIGRSRQENKEGYACKLRKQKEQKEAVETKTDKKKEENTDLENHFLGAIKVKTASNKTL
jgi:bifunctional UDP-N-acetylglucosamine pyrophosphorylase / glucosamine-1-phosphate N-acetyltransferase